MRCTRIEQHISWMGVDGEHTRHNRLLLQNMLSICEMHLAGSARHFLLDYGPPDKPRVHRRLSGLSWLVLGTLSGIVAIFATFGTSTRLGPKSLVRWDLLSLRLLGLHLLSGCMVLYGRSLISMRGLLK